MPKVVFMSAAENQCVDVEVGFSVMQAAVENAIPGIDGDCGGQAACATCHVYVEEEWLDKLEEMGESEGEMLDTVVDRRATSRLCCQIKIDDSLDGLVVFLPDA